MPPLFAVLSLVREYGVVGRGDMSYIFMLCSCRLNKCSISYWQSIMNFNTIKQQIEMIIMKNRWLYSLLSVSIIYLVLFYFNFTAYIGDYLEAEKCGFCIHCNGSVMCGTCKCARTLLYWIVKWWRLSLLHTLWLSSVLSYFLVQLASATCYAHAPLQCKSPFFECVALFLDSSWNFLMST